MEESNILTTLLSIFLKEKNFILSVIPFSRAKIWTINAVMSARRKFSITARRYSHVQNMLMNSSTRFLPRHLQAYALTTAALTVQPFINSTFTAYTSTNFRHAKYFLKETSANTSAVHRWIISISSPFMKPTAGHASPARLPRAFFITVLRRPK
ncbi:hypothetical protein D9M68_175100 [compost metagenome]